MSAERRQDRIRSAAAQAAALAAARKDIKRWKYGARERREPNKTDIRFGWGQTDWASDK